MKTKEYLLLAAITLFTLSNAAIGKAETLNVSLIFGLQEETPPTAIEMSRRETEWMKKDLSLTPAQLPVVDSLNYAYAQKRLDIRKNFADDRDKRRSEMRSLQDQKKIALEKILTRDQMKQYDISVQEHRGKMGNPPPKN